MCRWKNGLKSAFSANCVKNAVNYVTDNFGNCCTFAPQFKITPLTELAQEEARNDERPAFEGQLSSLSGSGLSSLSEALSNYDIIFIGGPIWWGTYPQVMFTFFDTYDLNGKTIYPFTTHEGSGLGNVMSDILKAYPNADVKPGFSIYGHEVRTNKAKVEKWIKGLGL